MIKPHSTGWNPGEGDRNTLLREGVIREGVIREGGIKYSYILWGIICMTDIELVIKETLEGVQF